MYCCSGFDTCSPAAILQNAYFRMRVLQPTWCIQQKRLGEAITSAPRTTITAFLGLCG